MQTVPLEQLKQPGLQGMHVSFDIVNPFEHWKHVAGKGGIESKQEIQFRGHCWHLPFTKLDPFLQTRHIDVLVESH